MPQLDIYLFFYSIFMVIMTIMILVMINSKLINHYFYYKMILYKKNSKMEYSSKINHSLNIKKLMNND